MAGAVSDDSDDEFSQALKCSIHLDVIKQPKALPCQHTFCKDCLVPLVDNNQIKCPLCREVCQLPANGVDGLRNNITLQNILDTQCMACQKRHKKESCPCCRQRLCNKCKIQHSSKFQTKIIDKKQDLRNMVKVLTKTSQVLDQNKTKFLSQAAKVKSELKTITAKERQAQLGAELSTVIQTETQRINECQENIKTHEQEILTTLQKCDGSDTDILENLTKLSENITDLLSTIVVSPATVSCRLEEQLEQDAGMGLGQIEYKPPQPGSGAPTALLQYQPVTIDYEAIGTPRRVFGQKGSGPGQFDHPSRLAVSPVSGNLVVCDIENTRIQVFTAAGEFLRMFGSKGQGEGQFDFGHSIFCGGLTVTQGGEIVITDTGNHRLQVFDETSGFIRIIGSRGSSPGYFNFPTGVTCDHSDHLYICDWHNYRVQVMTMDGSVLRLIAVSDVPGRRWDPVDIAVCPDGDLVVADHGTGLQVLGATGQHKATIPCGKGRDIECWLPAGVAVDPHGHIFVTNGWDTHRVYVVEKSGKLVCSFGGRGTSPGKFDQLVGVAVTLNGGIIIVDCCNNRVQIF